MANGYKQVLTRFEAAVRGTDPSEYEAAKRALSSKLSYRQLAAEERARAADPRLDRAVEAGKALIAKCDQMIEDTGPIFGEMELVRGRRYTGAQIGEELEAFRQALTTIQGE